jgi:sRNA-binding carbon storage regulator CsrA
MLIVSRKPSESIKIGKDITITIVFCDTSEAQLKIESPKNDMQLKTVKCEDDIHISDDVSVKVVEFYSGKIRLGINAPKSMRICRFPYIGEE